MKRSRAGLDKLLSQIIDDLDGITYHMLVRPLLDAYGCWRQRMMAVKSS